MEIFDRCSSMSFSRIESVDGSSPLKLFSRSNNELSCVMFPCDLGMFTQRLRSGQKNLNLHLRCWGVLSENLDTTEVFQSCLPIKFITVHQAS